MKKHIFAVLLGSLFLTQSPTAYSAINFDPSGSLVSDSDILPSGYSSYYFYYDQQRFGSAFGGQYDSNLVGGFRVGVRDKIEIGLSLPLRANHAEIDSGMPYIMANLRMRVASFKQGQQQLYLNVYRTTGELQSRTAITSGLPNQGFYFGLHNEQGRFKTRYLLGAGLADTRYYSAGTGGYAESRRYMLSAGARFGQVHSSHIWLDFIMKVDVAAGTQNNYSYIAPTLVFPKPNGTRIFVGAAFGYPMTRAVPHTEIVMGMSYRPPRSGHVYATIPADKRQQQTHTETDSGVEQQAPPESAAATEQSSETQKQPVQSPVQSKDMVTIDGGASSPEINQQTGVQTDKQESANQCKATIEIIYFSGQKQRAMALVNDLKAQGYCIKSVQAENLTVLKSEIYVRSDVSKETVAEVKQISGAQQQSVRQLPWGTDMRILLGKY